MAKKVLVAGATGQTGRRVVETLLERGVSVRALVRDLENAKEILPASAELVVGDIFQRGDIQRALAGCDQVICALGAKPSVNLAGPLQVDFFGTKNLIEIAQEQAIAQFVLVTSLCVSQFFHPLNLFGLILFWKKQTEAYLQNSGLPYTIVRPGGLRNENTTEPIVMAGPDTLFEGSIPRLKVAQACVAALSEPAAKNRIIEIVADAAATPQNWPELFQQVA